jgi:hypothetical protein
LAYEPPSLICAGVFFSLLWLDVVAQQIPASGFDNPVPQAPRRYEHAPHSPSPRSPYQPPLGAHDKDIKSQVAPFQSPSEGNQELFRVLDELKQEQAYNYYHSSRYLNDLEAYRKSRGLLEEMLSGARPVSVKDAFFIAESAYGDLHLSYKEYSAIISANADFIRVWLRGNRYSLTDPEALHFGIRRFLSDTLQVTLNGKKQTHLPYYYDYDDPTAQEDQRNYFVTKTLATGGGQCHTLPVVYLLLAEALGVKASLAYNPQHSFIRFTNNQGLVLNYETTVDRFLSDAYYMDVLPTMADAQRNRIFITELSSQQLISSVVLNMASFFADEHGLADGVFIEECLALADKYWAEQSTFPGSYQLRRVLLAYRLNNRAQYRGIRSMEEIEHYADVKLAYEKFIQHEELIAAHGAETLPEQEYLRYLEYVDEKKKLQLAKNIRSKEKNSRFIYE